MLEVTGLSAVYGQHRALDGVELRVAPGEVVVILGANGAGKSTLLKAISGVCEGRVTGTITLDGHDLLGLPANRIVDEGVALVPEGRGIFGDLTVRENLLLGAYAERAREDEAASLDRVLGLFPKLRERQRQTVRTMSGGEQQMVAIGRAMMSNPRVLTLDEPSLGLSPLLCKELFRSLATVRDMGLGILLVEQNAKQSLAIADRGYLLENACIVHEDTGANLARDPAVREAYLGAGGAAAPHTHDGQDAGPAPAPVTAPAPTPMTVAPRPATARSAEALLGQSISDLVARASRTAADALAERSAAPGRTAETGTPGRDGRLRATLADIERAARDARRSATSREYDKPRGGQDRPAAPAPSPPDGRETDAPPVIEIYRAPRVEVWRRRPGGDGFDRG